VKGRPGITGNNLLGKGVHFLKRDLIIFAFFLLLSFFFWYLNSLRKDIDIDLKYPVRYINPPRDRIADGDLPQQLVLNLKGPGYSIVKHKLSGSRTTVTIDFSKVTLKKVPDTKPVEYYIVSSSLIPGFTRQLRSDYQILSVKPDTIFVTFEKKGIQGTTSRGSSQEGDNSKK
jgi:hypothetical protein